MRLSRLTSPAAKPSFYFSTLPLSTAESSLPSRDPSDCAAFSASPSTSTSATTHHAIIVRPRPPSHPPFSLLYHQSPTDCRRHSIINRRQSPVSGHPSLPPRPPLIYLACCSHLHNRYCTTSSQHDGRFGNRTRCYAGYALQQRTILLRPTKQLMEDV